MQLLIGFFFLCMLINAMGTWFWILAFLIGGGALAFHLMTESQLTDEEKAERRRLKRKEEHAEEMAAIEADRLRRQLEIEAEHGRKQRRSAAMGGIGTTVAKVGIGLAIKALTGTNHRHRH